MIAVAIAGSALAVYYVWQDQPAQIFAKPAQVHAAPTVFGPGVLSAPLIGDAVSNLPNNNGLLPPGGLAATENGELVVNLALLDVIDFFFLEQASGDRANALKLYLQSKLPSPAYHEAEQIVGRYQMYMKEYDSLLAAQNFGTAITPPDIGRIAIWSEQRHRLRQHILGEKLVQAWYQNDDAQLQQVLDELQQRNSSAIPRWNNAADEAHHNAYMQDVLAKATRDFSALSDQRQQWSIPYAAFAEAANRAKREAQADPSRREFQIQKLLKQYFHTETERELARDRWESVRAHSS